MSIINTKARAEALGAKMKKALGPEWKITVWENLGWHASAHLGGIHVHSSYNIMQPKMTYWTLISRERSGSGGDCDLCPEHKEFESPVDAVRYHAKFIFKVLRERRKLEDQLISDLTLFLSLK